MTDNSKIILLLTLSAVGVGLFFTKSGREFAQKAGEAVSTEVAKVIDLTDSTLQLIKGFEGFSARKYPDASGYSIGYGHFILAGETFPEPMSEADAYQLLRFDVKRFAQNVTANVRVPLSQDQFDALTSLSYNIGSGAFNGSTLLKKLNAGDYAGASEQFSVWNKSQGKVLPALVNRRAKERAIFDRGTS